LQNSLGNDGNSKKHLRKWDLSLIWLNRRLSVLKTIIERGQGDYLIPSHKERLPCCAILLSFCHKPSIFLRINLIYFFFIVPINGLKPSPLGGIS
jgi:hypothetical protein